MAKRIDKYEVVVDGRAIVATRIPVETRTYDWGPVKEQKSLFEVRVDGELRGRLLLPTGFGSDWQAWSFGTVDHRTWDNGRPKHLNRSHSINRDGPLDVLKRFPSWIEDGKAPTVPELRAFIEEKEADEAARKAEDEANSIRYRAERAAEKAAAKSARTERLEILEGMRGRLRQQLTNLEASTLQDLINEVRVEIERVAAHEEAFGSDS